MPKGNSGSRLQGNIMSKKNKAKFKRIIRAQMAQEINKAQSSNVTKSNIVESPAVKPKISESTSADSSPEINLPQIKADLKKTGIVVAILAIIIGLLYYLDYKYGILLTFGDWLFKVLNIQ